MLCLLMLQAEVRHCRQKSQNRFMGGLRTCLRSYLYCHPPGSVRSFVPVRGKFVPPTLHPRMPCHRYHAGRTPTNIERIK